MLYIFLDKDYKMTGIEYIKKAVYELLATNSNGHDYAHIMRVYNSAMKFCDEIPDANRTLVAAAALLHDCDDYKLFGNESEQNLTNTRRILSESGADSDFREKCINIVKTIGYSKRINQIKPYGIEGEIVSDADMCDACGAIGILRCIEYRAGTNQPFFDPTQIPTEIDLDTYKNKKPGPAINHIFDKILRLRDMCTTAPGRKYAQTKHKMIVDFLKLYFDEVNAPQIWKDELSKYE